MDRQGSPEGSAAPRWQAGVGDTRSARTDVAPNATLAPEHQYLVPVTLTRLSLPDLLTRCAPSRRSERTVRPAALACFRFRKWHRFAGQEGRGSPPLNPSPPTPPASMPPEAWHPALNCLRPGRPFPLRGSLPRKRRRGPF